MTDFINGKIQKQTVQALFEAEIAPKSSKLQFSEVAQSVFSAGRELWRYYYAQPDVYGNASLYDICEWFQGRNDAGKMNS